MSSFRTWAEANALSDGDLHRFVADGCARLGLDLRLVPRRRGWWRSLYDIELHDSTHEQWQLVLEALRRMS